MILHVMEGPGFLFMIYPSSASIVPYNGPSNLIQFIMDPPFMLETSV